MLHCDPGIESIPENENSRLPKLFGDFIIWQRCDTIKRNKKFSNRSCESRVMILCLCDAKFCLHYHFRSNVCSIDENIEMKIIIHPWGGGTSIYPGKGCAICRGAFFEQKINFGVSFLVKSQVIINFEVSF